MSHNITTAFNNFFKAKNGHFVIWRAPNIPLWGWIACSIADMIMKHGKWHAGLHLLAQASLLTWAYLELRSGESMFRRVLGAVVLASTVLSFFK